MKIQFKTSSPISNFIFKNNVQTLKKDVSTQTYCEYKSSELLSNYAKAQVSFCGNKEIFEELQKYKSFTNNDVKKREELFSKLTNKVQNNINGVVEKFEEEGLTFDAYMRSCIKQPELFYISPKKVESNVRNLVKKFEKEGLSVPSYIKACVFHPSLFYQSPQTIETNVRDFVKKFKKDGLTVEAYLQACCKKSSLFSRQPDELANNVKGFVKNFENDGLTLQDYLTACLRQPSHFCQASDTLIDNVCGTVKELKKDGVDTRQYLKACLSHPALFGQLPNTVLNHINAFKFIEKDKAFFSNEDITHSELMNRVLQKKLCCANDRNYTYFLRDKFFGRRKPDEVKGESNMYEKMKNYFKDEPNKKYSITVIQEEKTQEFIEFCKKFSKDSIGTEDLFDITVVEP